MTRLLPFLSLTACITELPELANPCAPWEAPGIYDLSVDVDGKKRHAFVYVPPDSAGPRDLVIALHGAGSDGRTTAEVSRYIALAKEEGFVAAFPDGTDPLLGRPGWNAGDCCLSADEEHRDIDDVAYLDALVKELERLTCSDRVMVTGFSNGGMMTHRWACSSDAVDVAVPIAGTPLVDACKGDPIPMRHYHGTADPIVPSQGGGRGDFPPLDDAIGVWLERNGCQDVPPEVETFGILTCERYVCEAPTEVCMLADWKHQWPGGVLTSQTGGIDATKQSWDFFLEFAPPRSTTP